MRYLYSFFSILIVYSFCFSYSSAVSSQIREDQRNLRQQIHSEIPKGERYTQTIDIFIKKISSDDRKLNTLLGRVITLEEKLHSKETHTKKEQQILQLLAYIKYEIYRYVTPLIPEEGEETLIEEVIVKEPVVETQGGDISFFRTGESDFYSWVNSLGESQQEEQLKEIYEDFQAIPSKDTASHLSEEIKKIASWYDSEDEKSRDLARITDLQNIQSKIENYYAGGQSYPSYENIRNVISQIPKDEMGGIIKDNCRFGYIYEVWNNRQDYRLSSCLESIGDTRMKDDGGIDDFRYELGTNIAYHGKGRQNTNNSDIFYFSLVDNTSDGGSIISYRNWLKLDSIKNPTKGDIVKVLLHLEYQRDNPWIDKNLVLYHTINIVASAIDNYFLNGSILEIIDHNPSFAGKDLFISGSLEGGKNYKVGEIDSKKLGIDKKSLIDTRGKPIILGYANTGWGHYQILGFGYEVLEQKIYKKSLIRGTYSPIDRTLTLGKDFRITGTDTIEFIDSSLLYLFKRGEGINKNASIIWIDYETYTLTLDSDISGITEIVFDQPDGLIFDSKTGLPYKDGDIFP